MRAKTFGFLLLTAGAVAAAGYITKLRAPATEVGTPLLFPELGQRVNEVARVEVVSRLNRAVLVRDAAGWVIENRDRYPASFEKVKQLVLNAAELRVIEPKTSRPELHARLGVEDVNAERSASTVLTLSDGDGKPLASLVVGKLREGGFGQGRRQARYLRRAGENQVYLVEGELEVSADPVSWTERELVDVAGSRIREVRIEQPGQPPVVARREKAEEVDLRLQDLPVGFKPKSTATVTSLGTLLQGLRFDDVRASSSLTWPAQSALTTLRSFDGLVARVRSAEIDGRRYAAFEFEYDAAGAATASPLGTALPQGSAPAAAATTSSSGPAPHSVAEEAKALSERTRPWVYVLPDFKNAILTATLDGLIAKAEPPKPPKPMPDPLTVERFDAQGRRLPPQEAPPAP